MSDRSATWPLARDPLVLPASPRETARPSLHLPAETANRATHALGFLLSVWGAALMLRAVAQQPDFPRVLGCLIYLATLLAVYAASTLSHSVQEPRRLAFFQTLDQVCILLLVAGSYTPYGLVHLNTGAWRFLLAGMWGLCLAGIIVRIVRGPGSVAFRYFAAVAWLPALALGHVYQLSGLTGLGLVLGGGAAYTGGLWFLVHDHRHPYLHAVWHLCTILGSACHFLFHYWYVAAGPAI